jgi:hypothetical protein
MRLLPLVALLACIPVEPSKDDPATVDADGDGYGDVDCNDTSAAVHPGADEACDGIDNDCDGEVDDEPVDGTEWFADADGDGFGGEDATRACEAPADAADVGGDCDDADVSTHPGADEPCDEPGDRNCDGSVGYEDADADGWAACEECDDRDPDVRPDATEVCDAANVDEDCSGAADDADAGAEPRTQSPWYADGDADGYGAGAAVLRCDAPADHVSEGGDCDDAAPGVNPAAVERCDAEDVDENCDGAADDADDDAAGGEVRHADGDADGYGDPSSAATRCDEDPVFVVNATDCDDSDADINPGALEVCDEADADEDCDGRADDADESPDEEGAFYADADGDGYGDPALSLVACDAPAGYVADASDCDDGAPGTNPGATEACDAANVDEDCDVNADDGDTSASGRTSWYTDGDGDGYGVGAASAWCDPPAAVAAVAGDCDDAALAVNPGADEICNGGDDDCDGAVDDADTSLGDAGTWYRDVDADGYGGATSRISCTRPSGYVAGGGDCDDLSAAASPALAEVCDAEDVDEDCDGYADDADGSVTATTAWYADGDGDGYGDGGSPRAACSAPAGYVANATDCDDGSASVRPGAAEVCNAVDDDCDGTADDGVTRYYPDYDGDGYGDAVDAGNCTASSGAVTNAGDCDELSASVNPAATEVCGGADEDCDGLTDDDDPTVDGTTYYLDLDADGFGDDPTARVGCTLDSDEVDVGDDCDDGDEDVNPDAVERYGNDIDEDCDGETWPTSSCSGHDVPGDYATIAAAISALRAGGGTICLGAGTYSGDVSYTGVGAHLSFVGVSPEETVISGSFTFSSDANYSGVSLSNLNITGETSFGADGSSSRHMTTSISRVHTSSVDIDYTAASYAVVTVTNSRTGNIRLKSDCDVCGIAESLGRFYVTDNAISGQLTLYDTQQGYNYVYGNTIDAGSFGFRWDTNGSASGALYFYNNIITGASTAAIHMDSLLEVNQGYNLLYDNVANYAGLATGSTTYITADPLLDTSFDPPVPRTGSPAIGAATTSYLSSGDYWGRSRSTRTIGAVETY